ncbi:MAG: hydrogenase 4 subunit F [Fibrobacter sp.]|nr:hydrogenase 4 subunit F [Fibrobacter sp.]
MNLIEITVVLIYAFFAGGTASCFRSKNPAKLLLVPVISSSAVFLGGIAFLIETRPENTVLLFGGTLIIDSLSLLHILLVNTIFLITSIYTTGYFREKIKCGALKASYAKRFSILWQTFQAVLLLVLLSNNIGLMWISLEATTIVSAFLIISDAELSIEATWKYLLICSVGIVFAFFGTMLTVAAARGMQSSEGVYLFSYLSANADEIDPRLMLLAFILVVVGFGTKAGLSPMHTWLPDAHSQAPTPVSAVFSGVMLNCALFCIMRYLPITEAALDFDGQARSIVLLCGFMSLIFAAVFIPIQSDVKRMLAYCSVEHIGIIAIGLGLGGLGIFAALLHTVGHSLSKVLAFFSAGSIADHFGTREMKDIQCASHKVPLWGNTFFLSCLVLMGVAPSAVFMSEFLLAKELFFTGKYIILAFFLLGTLAVFFSMLRYTMLISFGKGPKEQGVESRGRRVDTVIVITCLLLLLFLGLWIPAPLSNFLKDAVSIIEKGATL